MSPWEQQMTELTGLCPACKGRRMNTTALLQADHLTLKRQHKTVLE